MEYIGIKKISFIKTQIKFINNIYIFRLGPLFNLKIINIIETLIENFIISK